MRLYTRNMLNSGPLRTPRPSLLLTAALAGTNRNRSAGRGIPSEGGVPAVVSCGCANRRAAWHGRGGRCRRCLFRLRPCRLPLRFPLPPGPLGVRQEEVNVTAARRPVRSVIAVPPPRAVPSRNSRPRLTASMMMTAVVGILSQDGAITSPIAHGNDAVPVHRRCRQDPRGTR